MRVSEQGSDARPTAGIGTLLGGGAKKYLDRGTMEYYLASLDFDGNSTHSDSFELTFLAHGITPSPNDPKLAVLFEKHGPGCCVVDLCAKQIVRTVTTTRNRHFYGHGVFSRDGSVIYCTESDLEDRRRGWIAVRDGNTFEYLGDFPSFGLAPHDCRLLDDGNTLVVTNGGSAVGEPDEPNVSYIDVSSRQLLERMPVPDMRLDAGHLAITHAGDLAVASAPRFGTPDPTKHSGGLSLRPNGQPFCTVHEPFEVTAQMLGETLSVVIHEASSTVGATNPEGHIVTFWHLGTGRLIRTLRVPNPRGIAISLSGQEFVIVFGATGKAARVSAQTLEPTNVPGNRDGYPCGITGSHVLIYDLASVRRGFQLDDNALASA